MTITTHHMTNVSKSNDNGPTTITCACSWEIGADTVTAQEAFADHLAEEGQPTPVHTFDECWQHNDISSTVRMMAAHRELLAGTAVCLDPEHVADAVAERLAEWEQEAEVEWSRTVSHEGWHAVKGQTPCEHCTPDERAAREAIGSDLEYICGYCATIVPNDGTHEC